MATASLRTLSPKTRAYKFTSTCKSEKIANTVTGSVAEINEPNSRQSRNANILFPNNHINKYVIPLKKYTNKSLICFFLFLKSINNLNSPNLTK